MRIIFETIRQRCHCEKTTCGRRSNLKTRNCSSTFKILDCFVVRRGRLLAMTFAFRLKKYIFALILTIIFFPPPPLFAQVELFDGFIKDKKTQEPVGGAT